MLIKYKNTNIFAFSDTHTMHWDLFVPDGTDVLICAGDAVEDELAPDNYADFLNWFESLPAAKHIFVPGDSEHIFTLAPKWGELLFRNRNIDLCLDTIIEYNDITFYGLASPEVSRHVAKTVNNIDFLITHFPPSTIQGISELHPHYHLFGHDHHMSDYREAHIGTRSYNVSKYQELMGGGKIGNVVVFFIFKHKTRTQRKIKLINTTLKQIIMKDLNNVKCVVNNIINETFTALQTVYQKQNNDLQIIFPEYASHNKRSGKIRISEQELRFAFVEVAKKLTKDNGWHYSVETPTYFYYKSARNGNDSCIGGARSGKIDLTLYDDSKLPVALIEFKAGSLSVDDDNHCNKALKYDMIKLIAETRHYQCLGYSLHLMDNSSYLKSFDSHLIAATEIIKGSKCLKEFESKEIKNFNLEISELKKYIFYETCILNK